jgi:hypothetical protein
MNKTTHFTPAFIKKIHKAHTTITRHHWRLVGTNRNTTKSVHFVLKHVPKLLKDWTKLYHRSNNGTFKSYTHTFTNTTRKHGTRPHTRHRTTRFTRRNHTHRRNTRTTYFTHTTRTNRTRFNTKHNTRNRFTKNAKRSNKHRFATHPKRYTNAKRNHRTRRAA